MDVSLQRIANLSPAKQELLALRIKAKLGKESSVPTIARSATAGAPAPLSFAQQRLWFLNQLEGDSASFNVPAAVRLMGPLDVVALGRSLDEIVSRHEILRTTFVRVNQELVQIVLPAAHRPLPLIDLSALPAHEREAATETHIRESARKVFNLSTGPLLQVELLQIAEHEHVMTISMHHIITDAWSITIFVREIVSLYEALARGEASPLAELPIQYADYARWQRQLLQGEVVGSQLSYWERQLSGAPPLLELPTDRPRPAKQTSRGERRFVDFSVEQAAALKTLSQSEGVTLFVTLLAAFQVLLRYYTGRDDMIVGTDSANRNRAEVEPLIGFFVNQLVMRTDLSGDPSFLELLQRTRATAWEAYAHHDVPFEQVVERVNPGRSPKYAPLFQVKLVLQNIPLARLKVKNLTLVPINIERDTAQLDLILNLVDTGDSLTGFIDYKTDLFQAATMARLATHLSLIFDRISAGPAASLSALEEMLAQNDKQERLSRGQELAAHNLNRLKQSRRKPLRSSETESIHA
jgi:hypothetical protein